MSSLDIHFPWSNEQRLGGVEHQRVKIIWTWNSWFIWVHNKENHVVFFFRNFYPLSHLWSTYTFSEKWQMSRFMSGFSLFPKICHTCHRVVTTVKEGISKEYLRYTRWWFQTFFYFHPYLGKWSNLTNSFSDELKLPTSIMSTPINKPL